MNNKLKLYSPIIKINNVVEENLLYLGKVDDSIIAKNKTFRELKSSDILEVIDYTIIENCDFILLPEKISKNSDITELIKLSKEKNKKILLFYNDDNDSIFNFENSIIFRTSLYKSKKPKNYLSVPAFSNDLKKEFTYFKRDYDNIPTIGFCGAITHNLRNEVLNKIKNFKTVKNNFIIRNSFWGGEVWGKDVRKEYIDNSINSDFVLCIRGAGNFSYRLYETMSLGRIPLVIDTDIDLPFEDFISYEDKILKIKLEDINSIEEKIINYWNNILDYEKLQSDIIDFWKSHLSPVGFIKTVNHFKNEINNILY
jgi:hypothetical protein